jgi:peptidoglycan hydrolase CwlO-like protein
MRLRTPLIWCAAMVLFCAPIGVHAGIAEDIAQRQQQIEQLQRQIDAFQAQAAAAGQQSQTLQTEISRLNAQIGQLNAQIQQLSASIDQTNLQIDQTTGQINDAQSALDLHRSALAQYLQETDRADHQSLAQILLQHDSMSDFFDYVHNIQRTQESLRSTIRSISDLQTALDQHRDDLEGKQTDLERLKHLQEIQKSELAGTKGTKNQLLKETKGQESKYQQLVKESQQNLARLQEEISYLLQGGLTVEDAVKYAKLAAIGAGIRPAFLLALLETESRLGRNVGTGNWRDDMYLCYLRLADIAKTQSRKEYYRGRAETEKSAYMAIIGKLGLDPDSVKVSREPSYGCGGAMGPAQFIPSTWLGYEADIVRITSHTIPNPWNFEDAFTASAVKLARSGATSKDRTGEVRAAKAYISGNPSCTSATCNSYANTILQKAAQIEQNL